PWVRRAGQAVGRRIFCYTRRQAKSRAYTPLALRPRFCYTCILPTTEREGEHAMTFIQQFIEKALVGGWQPTDRAFNIIGFYERHFEYQLRSTLQGRSSVIRMMVYEAVLLNPKVWQA